MGQPVAGSFLLGSPPFGLFARGAKIDDVAHVKLGGNQMLLQRATLARFGLERYPARCHWNTAIQSLRGTCDCHGECGYTPDLGQHTDA